MTIECPSCGTEVPEYAKVCKACFHPFREAPSGAKRLLPHLLLLLGTVASMVVIAIATLLWIVNQPRDQQVFVDESAHSVTWTRTYSTGNVSERLLFDDIARVEHVKHSEASYEVAVVSHDGTRHVIQSGGGSLVGEAEKYARMMDRDVMHLDLSD